MSKLIRFGVSIEEDLLEGFDRLISERGYANRSEVLRDMIRDALVQSRLDAKREDGEVLASLTLVYDHHALNLTQHMAEIQHDHHEVIVSVLHAHVSHDDCMEMIMLKGRQSRIEFLADALLSLKGVKHGKLFTTMPANSIVKVGKERSVRRHSHNHNRNS